MVEINHEPVFSKTTPFRRDITEGLQNGHAYIVGIYYFVTPLVSMISSMDCNWSFRYSAISVTIASGKPVAA